MAKLYSVQKVYWVQVNIADKQGQAYDCSLQSHDTSVCLIWGWVSKEDTNECSTILVINGFGFATVCGTTFQGGFTGQVDCSCVSDMCLEWLKMATVLQECTITEQHTVVHFLWVKGHWAKDIHEDLLPVYGEKCLSCKLIGLRNLHKDIQDWKTMTDCVAQWKLW
jgi:hypothetical protein